MRCQKGFCLMGGSDLLLQFQAGNDLLGKDLPDREGAL